MLLFDWRPCVQGKEGHAFVGIDQNAGVNLPGYSGDMKVNNLSKEVLLIIAGYNTCH